MRFSWSAYIFNIFIGVQRLDTEIAKHACICIGMGDGNPWIIVCESSKAAILDKGFEISTAQ